MNFRSFKFVLSFAMTVGLMTGCSPVRFSGTPSNNSLITTTISPVAVTPPGAPQTSSSPNVPSTGGSPTCGVNPTPITPTSSCTEPTGSIITAEYYASRGFDTSIPPGTWAAIDPQHFAGATNAMGACQDEASANFERYSPACGNDGTSMTATCYQYEDTILLDVHFVAKRGSVFYQADQLSQLDCLGRMARILADGFVFGFTSSGYGYSFTCQPDGAAPGFWRMVAQIK